jgi:hypothetical protein
MVFQGTIFFHYIQETDFKDNALYTCAAYNQELKEYKVIYRIQIASIIYSIFLLLSVQQQYVQLRRQEEACSGEM